MPTYSTGDFERIAAAVNVRIDVVCQYRNDFESAATWYRSDLKSPRRIPPSTLKRRTRQIAAAARKLLRHLEIYDYRNAADGPGDWALLEALASAKDGTEDDVIRATDRVARLAEIFDAIDALQFLEQQGGSATVDATQLGRSGT